MTMTPESESDTQSRRSPTTRTFRQTTSPAACLNELVQREAVLASTERALLRRFCVTSYSATAMLTRSTLGD